ncbi:MAG TPA: DinB family protein [Gemmatimonadales bacterium]|nr:DinB family protein [Gemmatimonadales bacterium]
MSLSPADRDRLTAQYEEGPRLLREAWARVPEEARQWRPGPGKWSAHEVIVHCADSETNAAGRIRYLLAEKDPTILGYDQDRWAELFDYHALPVEPAFQAIEAVRANTLPLIRRITEAQFSIMGRHTESGPYGVADWLRSYGEHLHVHVRQIGRNLEAWGVGGRR